MHDLQLNADLSRPVTVHGAALPWLPSPLPGVERRMLYRVGGEQARATSLVRYAPGSRFSAHVHGAGEEFVVLEGVFEDEHGRYPVGSYVRNPPGSAHAPGASEGCVIFVRLRQFHAQDRQALVMQLPAQGGTLFENDHERVWLEALQPGESCRWDSGRGLELLVLAGQLHGAAGSLPAWSWMRLPAGQAVELKAGSEGARVWLKEAALNLGG